MSFELVHKPTFTNQLLALPLPVVRQVIEKIQLLAEDPHPHGSVKKKLHGGKGNCYRLRSGDYRVLYTYGDGWVTLLGVDNRRDVYDGLDNLVAEPPDVSVTGVPGLEDVLATPTDGPRGADAHPTAATSDLPEDLLPVTIDADLLRRLRIPDACVSALIACRTLNDLSAAHVPEEVRSRVFDVIMSPDLNRILLEPDLVTGDPDDLLRYVEGELLGFLLRLSPEQERHVTRAMRGAGPSLVKGGPGTGKSTVALYRARALMAALRADSIDRPRLLFTTYTNALVSFSRQLLDRLLGPDDAALVEVRTADSVVAEVVRQAGESWTFAEEQQLRQLFERAVKEVVLEGNALQRRAQGLALERLGADYLKEEIETVIVARELASLDEYLTTPRAGREVALNASGRTAVWRVREGLERLLRARNLTTWSRLRRRASELVRAGKGPAPYDGVLIDEAQDLEPAALRTLVGLCRSTDRLFVTADANQSIYGSGFRWTDVHSGLRFTGRTGVLHKNYRSTQEIGEAAYAYLQHGEQDGRLDDDPEGGERREYVEHGAQPAVRAVGSPYDQSRLLARFVKEAARDSRLGHGACAILVPTRREGTAVAGALRDAGLEAVFMPGDALDLDSPCVKVLTLKSAKGLEFPIVAIAGLLDNPAPGVPGRSDAAARQEALLRERRTMFVGMTRAMRALLVVMSSNKPHELLDGFDPRYWNLS